MGVKPRRLARTTGSMPDAAPNEAENVRSPTAIVAHRAFEGNPKAYADWALQREGRLGPRAAARRGAIVE